MSVELDEESTLFLKFNVMGFLHLKFVVSFESN